MHRLVFALIFSLIGIGWAHAQTLDDLKHALVLQQQTIDRLQAGVNAQLGPQNVAAYLDAVYPDPMGGVLLVGWALQCGQTRPLLTQILIDGIVMENVAVATYPRPDVTLAFQAYCAPMGGLLPDLGATLLLDVSHYAAGSHTIALRLVATNGSVITSNTVTFVK